MRRRAEEKPSTSILHKPCDYCGRVPERSRWSFSSPFQTVVTPEGVKDWDGCDEGRVAGAPELIRQSRHRSAVAFAAKTRRYEADSPCPKCGNQIRITEFKQGRGYMDFWSPDHPHIVRTCGRCGCSEIQLPLDFDPDALYPPPKDADA